MKTKNIILTILLPATIAACQDQKKEEIGKTHIAADNGSVKSYQWTDLTDTTKSEVYYIQLNSFNFPDEDFTGKNIIDFKDSVPDYSLVLRGSQRQELLKLISDSSNFSNGDCGTFHLNAGFIAADKKNIIASIDIGCGYGQWNFHPENQFSKFGFLNDKGFREMEKLLDDINIKSQRSR